MIRIPFLEGATRDRACGNGGGKKGCFRGGSLDGGEGWMGEDSLGTFWMLNMLDGGRVDTRRQLVSALEPGMAAGSKMCRPLLASRILELDAA